MRIYAAGLGLMLIGAPAVLAATQDAEPPEREMLKMMEFLRDMEMIKQIDMLQEMQHLENSDPTKTVAPQKSPPLKKKEMPK
jgi:hypothetical protein